ncbi:uncharacterized protein LOC143481189 [Brachyhypopomus gauderio]|uniref:uncharacterized protein LOC143481189 n=1 Tax=Brachyhypopomus gauderio TaxID=698409 RepID=UPI004042C2B4
MRHRLQPNLKQRVFCREMRIFIDIIVESVQSEAGHPYCVRLPLMNSLSYEERALYLEAIILNHKENMTFEDFAAQVFSPSQSYYPTSGTGSLSGSTSAELSITVTTSESAEQVSPTMPRASKNRVSGKLRRSASAISKSSN